MKMKMITSLILGMTMGLGSTALAADQVYRVDSKGSKLEWVGRKVVGNSHNGVIGIKTGTVTFSDGTPVKAEIVVDMSTIKDLDLEDPKWNAKLVGHLKSDDFFGVEKHPEARLVLETFKKNGKAYDLEGKLTIKGKTHPVKLQATESTGQGGRKITARLSFDRTLFDVRYGSGKFFENLGDKMISDEIVVEATIQLEPKAFKTAQN